jgi:autotransporter-associated beta strand protein
MKITFSAKPCSSARFFGTLTILGLMLTARSAFSQTRYVWTNLVGGDASGFWITPANWSPNGLPISGDTADFSALDISVNSTIALLGDQTNANMIFGDATNASNDWIVDSGGTLTLESATVSPTITVTNRTATIQAAILGTNGFTKLGAGTLVLAGSSGNYTGFTTNLAGTLTIGAAGSGSQNLPATGPFGASTLVMSNGTLNVISGAGLIYNNILVPTGATVSMGTTVSGVQLALGGGFSGGGTINETGSQTAGTHLSGDNGGFTGTFNSTGGGSHRVRIDNPSAGSASANWNASATVTDGWGFTGFGVFGRIFFGSFFGNGTLRSDNGNNTTVVFNIGALNTNSTFSGTIVANGSQLIALEKVGTGALILSGNNTFNGFTTISNGVLQLGAGGAAGNIGSTMVTNYSRLVFSYNRSDTFAFPAILITGTGSLSFTNTGAGIMTLTGTNNETGDTTIAAGAVRLLNPLALPGGPGVGNVILNGTLDLNSNNIVINGLSGNGIVDNITSAAVTSLTLGSNDVSSTFNGIVRNSGAALSVTKVGAGKITLGGANTYKGNTTVGGGELDISTSQSGGGAITVAGGATLGVLVNSASSIPASTLTASDASVLSFSGVSSTTVAPIYTTNLAPAGTVTINVAGSFGVGNQYPLIQFSSSSGTGGFALGSLPTGVTANLLTNGSVIALNATGALPLVWKGNVNGNWDVAATANWTLNGTASIYNDGQSVVFDDTAATGNVNLTANVAPGGLTVNNNSLNYILASATGNGITGSGITGSGITGSGSLTKQGTGTLTLSGLTNSFSGFTTINGGKVVIDADANLGLAGTVNINGGALSAASSLTLIANRTLALGPSSGAGGGAIDVAAGQTLTFTGAVANYLTGTGSLTKTGAGTLVLNGANTYGGNTVVSGGALSLTAAQQTGGAITVADGATLSISRAGGNTFPASTLTLGSGGATTLGVGNLNASNAVITATNLTTAGTVTLNVLTSVPALGETPLIQYSGSIGGAGFSAFALAPLPPGVTGLLTNDTVNHVVGLQVTSVSALTWTGANGPTWDLGITTNWQILGSNVTFKAGNAVIFDDTGLSSQVNLSTSTEVFDLLVTNNTLNYTLGGNGGLTGPMTLTKTGAGTLTVANLGNNNYSGGTVVQQGTLDVHLNDGLGTGALTLAGGTIENNSATTLIITNAVNIQADTTNILQSTGGADPQLLLTGNLTGSGTLVAVLQGGGLGGIGLSGDNSGFTGTFVTSNNTSLRFNFNTVSSGSANANWVLNSTGTDNQRIAFGNGTIAFGSLSGTGNCRQDVPNTLSILRIGDLNTDSSWGGTLNQGNGTQRIGILKAGAGTWTVTASQPYTGPTTISNGVLALATDTSTLVDGALPATPSIYIATGAALDVSGRSDGNISLLNGQVLSGNGTVCGSADSYGGGVIAPGDGLSGNVGTLTVTNVLSLGNLTWMKLNRAAGQTSDLLVSPNPINLGGALVVTNVGPVLRVGDTFKLFNAPLLNGAPTPVLPALYAWNTDNLTVDGTITVTGVFQPVISSVDFGTLASGSITLNATNGIPNSTFEVLSSTNVALSATNWIPMTTNTLDGSGNFSGSITVDPTIPRQFFQLQMQLP